MRGYTLEHRLGRGFSAPALHYTLVGAPLVQRPAALVEHALKPQQVAPFALADGVVTCRKLTQRVWIGCNGSPVLVKIVQALRRRATGI